MNKIFEILKFIDEFFQKGPQGLTYYDGDFINPHLKQINQSMDEKTSQHFKQEIEKIDISKELSIQELSKKIFEMFGNLGTSEILEFFYNFIETTKENLESVFYLTPMLEKNIYEKLNPLLKDLSNSYPDHFKKAAMWILSTQGDSSDYSQEAESIMIIHDELMNLEKEIENVKFSDISTFPDKIIAKIQKLDSNKFKLYFKDWVLKFSLLVESKFKYIFIFLNYFWKIEEKQEVSLNKLKHKMLGPLFKDFNMKQNYPNIDRFRVYRNKTFHAGIEFMYDEKWENRHMILGRNLKLTITEFLFDFEKLFRFLNTFYVMVNIIVINIKIDGKSAFDQYLDDLKKAKSD